MGPWGAKGSSDGEGTRCFDPCALTGRGVWCSSTAAGLIDPELTQPALLILSTDLRCLHEATQRRTGVLCHPVGSQAPTVQEGDKNRRAARRLRRHYS